MPPLLRRAWYSLNQVFRQRIADLSITPDQYSILRWLDEIGSGGLTQKELTGLMSSDPNTIAATLQRMETAGLVRRSPHQCDRRAICVSLEEGGKLVFEKAQRIATGLQREILEELSSEEADTFLSLLEKVAVSCSRKLTESRS
jgi:DNA-binding MarR family transcriptional regulator